jgi:hypothetical protein
MIPVGSGPLSSSSSTMVTEVPSRKVGRARSVALVSAA